MVTPYNISNPHSKSVIEAQPPTLPANTDSEAAVLGAILSPTKFAAEFFLESLSELEGLDQDAFSLDSHRRIWNSMVMLAKANKPVDLITVTEELMRSEKDISVRHVGGHGYLDDLRKQYFPGMDINWHLRHIKALGIRRLAYRRLHALDQLWTDTGTGLNYVLGRAEEIVMSLRKLAAQ